MQLAKNQVSIAIQNRDMSVIEFCKINQIKYPSLMATIHGSNPVFKIVRWLAINEPELFNLLPENSRRLVKGEYDGCNIPR